MEVKLNQLDEVNVLHLRPAFYMENAFYSLDLIKQKGINGLPANGDHAFSIFWISDRVSKGQAKGLGAGFGGNYTSDAFQDDGNTFVIPGYTLGCHRLYAARKYRLGVKMNTLANTKTWNRYCSFPTCNGLLHLVGPPWIWKTQKSPKTNSGP